MKRFTGLLSRYLSALEEEWSGTPCTGRPIQLPADTREYTLEGLEPGMRVHVEVRAVNAIGPGELSPTLSDLVTQLLVTHLCGDAKSTRAESS